MYYGTGRNYTTTDLTGTKNYVLLSNAYQCVWNNGGSRTYQYIKTYNDYNKANADYKSWLKGNWGTDYKKLMFLEIDTDTGVSKDISYADPKMLVCRVIVPLLRKIDNISVSSSRITTKGITISVSGGGILFDKTALDIIVDTILENHKQELTEPIKIMLNTKEYRTFKPQPKGE